MNPFGRPLVNRLLDRVRSASDTALDAGFILAIITIGLIGFRRAYGGHEYLIVGFLGAALGVGLVWYFVTRKTDPILAATLAIASVVVLAGPIVLRSESLWGFIPTLESFVGFVDGAVRGWSRLVTTSTPTGGIDHLLVVPYLTGFLGGLTTMMVARKARRVFLALVIPIIVFCLAILLGTDRPVMPLLQGASFLAVGLLWLHLRAERNSGKVISTTSSRERWVGVGLMILTGVVGAVVFGPGMPLSFVRERVVLREEIEPPFDPRSLPSPLSSFRKYKVEMKDEVLFTVDSVPEGGVTLPLAVMDVYDGVVWNVSQGRRESGHFERVGEVMLEADTDDAFGMEIQIGKLTGFYLPLADSVIRLRFLGDRADEMSSSLRFNHTTSVAAVPIGLAEGDVYEIVGVEGEVPSAEEMRRAAIDKSVVYEKIDGLGATFEAMAAGIVMEAANPFDQALALESYFQNGAYSDGGPDSVVKVPPGHSLGHILSFVADEIPVGDGEQYAATMTLMARSLGLPARVVVGFELEDSDSSVAVKGSDIEAWVEIGFADVGWVSFYPTPDESNEPQVEEDTLQKKTQVETQVPPPVTSPPQLTDPLLQDLDDSETDDDEEPEDVEEEGGFLGLLVSIVGIPLILLAPVGIIWFVKWRRRERRRRTGEPARRISRGWVEVLDLALDRGLSVETRATRREAGLTLGERPLALATTADAMVFGPEDPSEADSEIFWGEVDSVLSDMTEGLSRVEKLKTIVSLRSLRASGGKA